MKEHQTLPTDKSFFDAYAGFVRGLKVTGILAQVLSFCTQVPPLFLMTRAMLTGIIAGAVAGYISLGLAVTASAAIEIGARLAIPYAARQVLYKRYSGLHLPMTIGIFIIVIVIPPASIYISFAASKAIVKEISTPPVYTAPSDSLYKAVADSLNAVTAAEVAHIQAAADKAAATLRRARYNTTDRASQAAILAQEGQLAAQTAERIADAKAVTATAAAANEARHQDEVKEAKAAHAAALAEFNRKVTGGGNALAWLTLILSIVSYISMILEEVKKKGAGIQQIAQIGTYEHRPGVFAEAWEAISDRVNAVARGWIARFADKTPPPPEPSQYHLPSSTADRLRAIEEAIQNQNQTNQPPPPTQQRQQIGFHQGTPPAAPPVPQAPTATNKAGQTVTVDGYATGSPARFQVVVNKPGYRSGLYLTGQTIQPATSLPAEQWQGLPASLPVNSYQVAGFKPCQECGANFMPKNHWHYFCSGDCRTKADNRNRVNRKRT